MYTIFLDAEQKSLNLINHLIAEYVEYRPKTTEFSSQSSRAKDKKRGTFLLTLLPQSHLLMLLQETKRKIQNKILRNLLSQMLLLKIPSQISTQFQAEYVCVC